MAAYDTNQNRIQLAERTYSTILVATLGFFVDAFDLLLFSVVRVQSLTALGLSANEVLSAGLFITNCQMAGLLVGGFLWGVLGDKFGRVRVLMASIGLYAVATLANAAAVDVTTYALCRFIAGIGLAGELGISATLISEIMPPRYRGLGTAFLGFVGTFGVVAAGVIGGHVDWRTAYLLGGALGVVLLFLRFGLRESNLFLESLKTGSAVARGDLIAVFTNGSLLKRYLAVIFVPLPLLTMIWILVAFTPEFAKSFGAHEALQAGTAIIFCYIGLSVGDGLCGLLSQFLHSRKKAIAVFLLFLALSCTAHLLWRPAAAHAYYASCLVMGLSAGYWIVAVQLGAEQFGTNLRATAAVSVPTVARALIIPAAILFHMLAARSNVVAAWTTVMLMAFVLAVGGLVTLKDSFDRDLDYLEPGS